MSRPRVHAPGDTDEAKEAVLLDELTRRLVLLTRTAGPPLLRWIEENDVSVREARMLVALLDSPRAGKTAGELAESTGLSVEEAVRAGNDLRARGLARSGRRIQLTARGQETVEELEKVRAEGLRAYLAALPPTHRDQLARSLEPSLPTEADPYSSPLAVSGRPGQDGQPRRGGWKDARNS